MAKGGRPRLLDETKRREICAMITSGAGLRQAARHVGCSVKTIRREAARNEEFGQRLRQAESSVQLSPLQAMRQAARSNWRAAAWMLERFDPERFGRRPTQAFGAAELRALARDLLKIFNDEIDDPLASGRIEKRLEATIRYAMRHAWDTRRTGDELQRAMDFLDKHSSANSFWDKLAAGREASRLAAESAQPQDMGPLADPFDPIPGEFRPQRGEQGSAGAGPTDRQPGQNR